MPEPENNRLLKALRREPVDRTPVWLMRQAGRYLPEYRKIREQAGSFMSLCRNPELACEVTLQPLARYPLDAAILFSDILTIPDAMGLGLYFAQGEGPHFERPVADEAAIRALSVPDPEAELGYVMEAVRHVRRALDGRVPLIGFTGSPWTLATYMVEGGPTRQFAVIKRLIYDRPDLAESLMNTLSESVGAYITAQVDAGAQAAMVFDTWGGVLADEAYRRWSLAPMARVVERLKQRHPDVPVIAFTKGGGLWLEAMADSGCDALGLDWTVSLGEARRRVGERVALQGNVDPCVVYARPEVIREEVGKALASFGNGSGHVFNLGHGISPDMDPAHIGALIEAVVELSPRYHAS